MKIAILISGHGSNMLRIADQADDNPNAVDITRVIANKPCEGLTLAAQRGLKTSLVDRKSFGGRTAHERAIAAEIERSGAEWVVLAGYMAILSPSFVDKFANRIVNIHPSLLPALKGLDTHARAISDARKRHGATVHLVNAELDDGPIILQAGLDIQKNESKAALAARVLRLEHALYPFVITALSRGWLTIENGVPVWRDGQRRLADSGQDIADVLLDAVQWPEESQGDNLQD